MDGKRQRVRTRALPRNADNQIYCDHQDCQPMPPTFRRPCEWSKHMDKHDRPFRCHEPGCNRGQGFTYSGGLLRHQREVHKKYTNAITPIVCPYTDCNRSSGNGFTRRENLREHLRRRHRHTDDVNRGTSTVVNPWITEVGVPDNHLPAAFVDNCRDDSPSEILSEANDKGHLRNEFKQLLEEVQEQNRRLKELEHTVAALQSAIAPSSPLQLTKQYVPS
ncbi:Zinc finger C2H2 type domain-containing protein [Penicillium ucsense]|uniref:Zinc finger C2H2 type domain-containing protein n=1 Tax=Penicillium ucsense TaxID=2839758 RepID=A0A8J8WDW0_9EURO|nr:Zinc finger C2H2 type domain-containing protein [Penicillium ucsense]KAF7730771.1 Zinc finger C2H2 type domain-containing protein [Penicillium ucsense]